MLKNWFLLEIDPYTNGLNSLLSPPQAPVTQSFPFVPNSLFRFFNSKVTLEAATKANGAYHLESFLFCTKGEGNTLEGFPLIEMITRIPETAFGE